MPTLTLNVDDLVVSTFNTGAAGAIETDIPYSPYCCTEDNSGCDTNVRAGCTDAEAGCWATANTADAA